MYEWFVMILWLKVSPGRSWRVTMFKSAFLILGFFQGMAAQAQGDFDFGVAIAGFQAEMGCPSVDVATCDDQKSDQHNFEKIAAQAHGVAFLKNKRFVLCTKTHCISHATLANCVEFAQAGTRILLACPSPVGSIEMWKS